MTAGRHRSGRRAQCVCGLAGLILATVAGLPDACAQGDGLGDLFDFDPMARLEERLAELPREPQRLADAISGDVAQLRGLEFQRPIRVSRQSLADFEIYLDGELERSLPPERAAVLGRVVQSLGLYSGPVIEDPAAVMRLLATSQIAAYYSPEQTTFYVLLQDAPLSMLAPIYAHELYHGLQDQYWNLDAYLLDAAGNGLNDDEVLARQSVVEGEATYVMNLWLLEQVMGQPPSRLVTSITVLAQSLLTGGSIDDLVGRAGASGALTPELEASVAAMDEIPPFMLETLIAAYLKGMAFVHFVAGQGWDAVANLYEDPPQSSEQILHPEKYFARDEPVRIDFDALEAQPEFADWNVLDSNVIGEFQWRLIFGEFGMKARAAGIASGWDGDRYAVLEKDGRRMTLFATRWDSEGEATEFEQAYRELLNAKFGGQDIPRAIARRGSDVTIVEGGDAGRSASYIEALDRATRRH